MTRHVLLPKGAPPPLAPYSPGVRVGNTIHVSGVLAMDAEGKTVAPGDVAGQTRQVLDTIGSILAEGGASFGDIAFNAIFLKRIEDYAAMNAVYAEYFPEAPPARYCVIAELVRPDFLVEIVSTAYVQT